MSLMMIVVLMIAGLLVNRRIQQNSRLSLSHEIIESGGISEVREVTIGGITQYIAIEGQKLENPLCLFIHGGPGLAVPFGISARTQYSDLISHCTAVYWDQRGAGKTFSEEIEMSLLTLNQLQLDAMELIDYLLNEFKQEKLYLMGHSWGSVVGMRLVQTIPDRIEAYVGISQVIEPRQSDQLLYQWLIDEFDNLGEIEMVKSLKRIGAPPYYNLSFQEVYNQAISSSEAYRKMNDGQSGINIMKWILNVWTSSDLTLKEVYQTLFKASEVTLTRSGVWKELSNINFNDEIKEVSVPVYFISGKDDYICSKDLMLAWTQQLLAPVKETLILNNSAHYLSTEDERLMFEWIKSIIEIKYPQEEEELPAEEDSVISTLINQL